LMAVSFFEKGFSASIAAIAKTETTAIIINVFFFMILPFNFSLLLNLALCSEPRAFKLLSFYFCLL